MPAERIPHARETDRARPLPQEDATVSHDQPRRRDVDHGPKKAPRRHGTLVRRRRTFVLSLSNDNNGHRGPASREPYRRALPNIQRETARLLFRWRRWPRKSRSVSVRARSSASSLTSTQTESREARSRRRPSTGQGSPTKWRSSRSSTNPSSRNSSNEARRLSGSSTSGPA